MSEQVSFGDFELVVSAPPVQKEQMKPGFRKLTIESIEAQDLVEGKSPVVHIVFTKDGEKVFTERFYFSGKPSKEGPPFIYKRVNELFLGLTGDKFSETVDTISYNYEGNTYSVANPAQVSKILNKKLAGKSAIYRVGGTQNGDKTYLNLTPSGFLLTADFDGNVKRYEEERDFTQSESNWWVKKEKPATSEALSPPPPLSDLPF